MRLALTIAALLVPVIPMLPRNANAGVKVVGNGGTGIVLDGRLFLLDLAEAGIEKQPFFSLSPPSPFFLRRARHALSSLEQAPAERVARKLSELHLKNPVLALLLLKTMELYSWRSVDLELDPIRIDESLMNFDPASLRHLATRFGQVVMIQRIHWKALDEGNRAALIFHELLYALVPPRPAPEGGEEQAGLTARQANAEFFLSGGYEPARAPGVFGFLPRTPETGTGLRLAEDSRSLAFARKERVNLYNPYGLSLSVSTAGKSAGEVTRIWEGLAWAEEGGPHYPDKEAEWIVPDGGELSAEVKRYRNPSGSDTSWVRWSLRDTADGAHPLRLKWLSRRPGHIFDFEGEAYRSVVEKAMREFRQPFASGMENVP